MRLQHHVVERHTDGVTSFLRLDDTNQPEWIINPLSAAQMGRYEAACWAYLLNFIAASTGESRSTYSARPE